LHLANEAGDTYLRMVEYGVRFAQEHAEPLDHRRGGALRLPAPTFLRHDKTNDKRDAAPIMAALAGLSFETRRR
jgi:hypothetical protein